MEVLGVIFKGSLILFYPGGKVPRDHHNLVGFISTVVSVLPVQRGKLKRHCSWLDLGAVDQAASQVTVPSLLTLMSV